MRPSAPTFEQRKAELTSGLIDLSDQAVEVAEEEAAPLPPATPVPLARRATPALPLPLVRKSAPTLAELGASLPPAPANDEDDDDRIDLEAIAKLTRPSDPLEVQRALSSRPPAQKSTDARRIVGVVGGVVALLGIGFLIARVGFAPASDASAAEATRPEPTAAEPAAVVEPAVVPAEEPAAVELAEVRVEASPARAEEEVVAEPAASEPATESAARVTAPAPTASPRTSVPHVVDRPASAPAPVAQAPTTAVPAAEPAPASPAPAVDLPAAPTRDDVLAALRPIEGQVRTCAEGHYGVVPVRVTVASSGRVTTAVVTGGSVLGTPAGSCIARAVRGARFPAFSQDRFVVDYPFAL